MFQGMGQDRILQLAGADLAAGFVVFNGLGCPNLDGGAR